MQVTVPLVCPADHAPLTVNGSAEMRCDRCGAAYPVVFDIPILLPDAAERDRLASTDWSKPADAASALSFYNLVEHNKLHAEGSIKPADLDPWIKQRHCDGPVVEVGSGCAHLQGVREDYVAVDYGFTSLRDYVNPRFQRICATAESLPFPDRSVGFLFTINALEHVPRADLAFDEIDRVLKPGGVAYVSPAWHCMQLQCDGVPVLSYRELSVKNKIIKLLMPAMQNPLAKAAHRVPRRLLRRIGWMLAGRPRTKFQFKRLRPCYDRPLCADSDAASSIDSHEAALYFTSRGFDILHPSPSALKQLLSGSVALIVRKPGPDKSH